jgi:hypothetical protein
MFIYPIYYHNWRNISTIYVYITRLASNEIFSPSNKIHREVGRAKELSAPRYKCTYFPVATSKVGKKLSNLLFRTGPRGRLNSDHKLKKWSSTKYSTEYVSVVLSNSWIPAQERSPLPILNLYSLKLIKQPTRCSLEQLSLLFLGQHSICFGCSLHPSSGVS